MKKIIINILMVLFLLMAIGCGGYLAYYYYSNNKSESAIDGLREQIVDINVTEEEKNTKNDGPVLVDVGGVKIQKKFERLYSDNHDFVGWIKINDTNVDYPVMYTPNDNENGEYYIHRDYDEQYSAAGLPFIDSNCIIEPATDNLIIYGHNMNSGSMFHDILKYAEQEFYDKHKTFTFDSIYDDGTYEVIAAFYGQILPEESDEFKYYEFVNAGNEKEFLDYVKNVQAMSVVDTGVNVEYGDKLLTLSTCAYHVRDGRFAVVARKIN